MKEIHYLIGNLCNLNCDFCFWDIRMPDVPLSFKKKIVDQIVDSGIKKVTLSGGEPLCTNDFLEILEYMHKQKLEVVLHTNGLEIDNKIARKIAPLISRVSLTMDAVDPTIQIRMRKNNKITGHTIELIKTFNQLKTPVNIKTLVTKINKNEIENIGNVLTNLPIAYWSLLKFIPMGRGKVNNNKFAIDRKVFDSIHSKMRRKFPSMKIKIRKFGGSANNYGLIAPNGNVYTNAKKSEDILIGNIGDEGLKSLTRKIELKKSVKVVQATEIGKRSRS